MMINCGPTYAEKYAASMEWHSWFAWRPVRVGSGDCRWLERIERKGREVRHGYDVYREWEYRA